MWHWPVSYASGSQSIELSYGGLNPMSLSEASADASTWRIYPFGDI